MGWGSLEEDLLKTTTGRGDDGWTDPGHGNRVEKDDPEIEVYGALDEAAAFVQFAYSLMRSGDEKEIAAGIRDGLGKVLSELAQHRGSSAQSVGEEDLKLIEQWIERLEVRIGPLSGWAVFGESSAAAALNCARTILRRAERRLVTRFKTIDSSNEKILAYLNRLSDLVYLLALYEEKHPGTEP